MCDVTYLPVSYSRHVAQQQMDRPHGWWGLFTAWVKGARRG